MKPDQLTQDLAMIARNAIDYIRELERERDALLEACQTLVNLPEDWIATLRLLRVAVEQARAAIKAVEEGK